MTDEEIAIDWIRSQGWNEETLPSDEFGQMFQAFLAGLKAGRPKWHKVADGDLPTEEKDYIVKLTDGTVDVMTIALDGDLEPYLLTPKFDFYKDVEKWCEIPKE